MKWNQDKAKKIAELLDSNGNNVADACRIFGISRDTFYEWKKKHPTWGKRVDDAKEVMLDNVESAIYKGALEGNVTAQIFILKTQGRKRGWIENVAVTVDIPQSVRVEIVGGDTAPISREEDLPNE